MNESLFQKKYKIYIILFHLIYIIHLFNSSLIPRELLLLYPVTVTLLEHKMLLKKENIRLFLLFFSLFIISIFLFLYRNSFVNGTLIFTFISLFVFSLIYLRKNIGYKIHETIVIVLFLLIIVSFLRGIDPNQILMNRSRNMVSFYFMMYVIFYYIQQFRYTRDVSLWPALLSLIVSMLMIGRSGIISSSLLFVGIIFFNYRYNDRKRKMKNIILMSFLGVFLFLFLQSQLSLFVETSTVRFSEMNLDLTGRDLIWNEYHRMLHNNILNFILGFPLENQVFETFDFNLHSSYLSLHYFLGFFGIVIIGMVIYSFCNKGELFYKFLLFVLLLRGFSDQLFFFNYNDVVVFYLIFLLIYPKEELKFRYMKCNLSE